MSLSMDYIQELLAGDSKPEFDPSNGYMLVWDGEHTVKMPIDSTACGVWIGKKGTTRKLMPSDVDVLAVVSHVVVG